MKKRMLSLLLVLMILCTLPLGASGAIRRGDVNFDGKITAADARLALRRAVGLESYAAGTTAFLACDVNGDGVVIAADARIILRIAVGLPVDSFPDELTFRGFYFPLPDGMAVENETRTEDYMHYTGLVSVKFYYIGRIDPEDFTDSMLDDFCEEHQQFRTRSNNFGQLPFHAIRYKMKYIGGSTMDYECAMVFNDGEAVLIYVRDQGGSFANAFDDYLRSIRAA